MYWDHHLDKLKFTLNLKWRKLIIKSSLTDDQDNDIDLLISFEGVVIGNRFFQTTSEIYLAAESVQPCIVDQYEVGVIGIQRGLFDKVVAFDRCADLNRILFWRILRGIWLRKVDQHCQRNLRCALQSQVKVSYPVDQHVVVGYRCPVGDSQKRYFLFRIKSTYVFTQNVSDEFHAAFVCATSYDKGVWNGQNKMFYQTESSSCHFGVILLVLRAALTRPCRNRSLRSGLIVKFLAPPVTDMINLGTWSFHSLNRSLIIWSIWVWWWTRTYYW